MLLSSLLEVLPRLLLKHFDQQHTYAIGYHMSIQGYCVRFLGLFNFLADLPSFIEILDLPGMQNDIPTLLQVATTKSI